MSNIEKEGQALLERWNNASGNVGHTKAGVERVREYDAAKLALARFVKNLTSSTQAKSSVSTGR